MATITASMVKDLREATGAGMMDCKKALTETDGDMEKAVVWLRENGLAKAAKKESRIAAEGICAAYVTDDNKTAAVVEVNSETDFVAKNEKFQEFVAKVAKQAAATDAACIDCFLAEPWCEDASISIKEALANLVAVIGEKLSIRRFEKIVAEDGFVVSYIHNGGKLGILVQMKGEANEATIECAKNVAMQVCAMKPAYVRKEEISADFIASETEIITKEALKENAESAKPKPENIVIERIVPGRLDKELKEICLVDQIYVKDQEKKVAAYVASVSKDLDIVKFVRFETGEGMEKREENFAEEVAKQMGQ
ncbi:MAG: translation elongation factor Ts [Lachnospiraceae bacterium]|nr:translation elongation factor Ts [Lachnospiraceae bacterium]